MELCSPFSTRQALGVPWEGGLPPNFAEQRKQRVAEWQHQALSPRGHHCKACVLLKLILGCVSQGTCECDLTDLETISWQM